MRYSPKEIRGRVDQMQADIPPTVRPSLRPGPPQLVWEGWIEITGNASLATNRWKYSWEQVIADGDSFSTVTNGISGTTTTDYALNTMEFANTSSLVGPGVDPTGTDYAASDFDPKPISDGAIVWGRQTVDDNGALKIHFTAENAHDGDC